MQFALAQRLQIHSRLLFGLLEERERMRNTKACRNSHMPLGSGESITFGENPVTQNRMWHGATYVNGSHGILIYAGSQDGSQTPTAQSFLY